MPALRRPFDDALLLLREQRLPRPVLLLTRPPEPRQSAPLRIPSAQESSQPVLDQAWPAHKVVCGDRANPFRLPPFSRREADQAWLRYCQSAEHELQLQLQKDLSTMCLIGTGKDVQVRISGLGSLRDAFPD